jgi:O-antigen ligase
MVVLTLRSLQRVHSSWWYYRPFLWSTGLIGFGGVVGTLVAGYGVSGITDLFRFGLSTLGLLVMFGLWAPDRVSVRLLMWAFLAGAALNAILGSVFLRDGAGRAIGLSAHSNHFAVASLLACGAGVGLALTSEGARRHMASALTALVGFGMVASGSRAAIAGILAFGVLFLMYAKQWRLLIWCLSGSAVIALLLVSGVVRPTSTDALGRLIGKDPTAALSDDARSTARSSAVRSIEANPITGVGFSTAKEAHNVYLQLWAASGLFGLAGAFGLLFGSARMVWVPAKKDILSGALVCSYGGYLVAAAFSTVLWDRYLWLHVALALALCSERRRPSWPCENGGERSPGLEDEGVVEARR